MLWWPIAGHANDLYVTLFIIVVFSVDVEGLKVVPSCSYQATSYSLLQSLLL